MLDSGAFTAWRKNEVLDVKKYIAFIKKTQHLFHSYVSLDSIPGKSGLMQKGISEVEASANLSNLNHKKMKDAGLKPIPVFHQGEKITWLEKMLKDGEHYIGISPYLRAPQEEQVKWMDDCFNTITTRDGFPVVKTHGFGGANQKHLQRYPWTTADSSSWSIDAGHGHILVPSYTNGKFDYLRPTHVPVTGIAKEAYSQRRQFSIIGKNHQEITRKFLKEEVGINMMQARYDQNARMKAYLIYTQKLLASIKCDRFTNKSGRFFTKDQKQKPIKYQPVEMVFATNMNGSFSSILNEVGANFRLLSYYEIKDVPLDDLEAYVATGMPSNYQKRKIKTDWSNPGYRKHRLLSLAKRATDPFMCGVCGNEGATKDGCQICGSGPNG